MPVGTPYFRPHPESRRFCWPLNTRTATTCSDAFLDNRLKTVVGRYFFIEKGQLTENVQFVGGLLQIDGPNQFKTNSYAGFAQADYKVTDQLGANAGVRYTRDEKQFAGGQRDCQEFRVRAGV